MQLDFFYQVFLAWIKPFDNRAGIIAIVSSSNMGSFKFKGEVHIP